MTFQHYILIFSCSTLNWSFSDYNHSERTRVLLMSAAYVHLKHCDISRHTRNLSPASRAILLSGPTGINYDTSTSSTVSRTIFVRAVYDVILLSFYFYILSIRTLPADACQGSRASLRVKVAVVRRFRLFPKGILSTLKFIFSVIAYDVCDLHQQC